MKILISGSHGFVGTALLQFLESVGEDVWRLSRFKGTKEDKTLIWDPLDLKLDQTGFEGFDAVIHLAGENIGKGWWTDKRKASILKSRCEGTARLVEILASLEIPPKTFICASAVGYYGSRGEEILTEESSPGSGQFLSEVCRAWESAASGLERRGVRVIYSRFGMVLSPNGGALEKMLPLFRWGLGGRVGKGDQYISWIALDDLVSALYHILKTSSIEGAVNCVSPHPIMNKHFSKELAKGLNRWLGPPFPSFMVRLLLGQKGEELLLSSVRVEPKVLIDTGYRFKYPEIDQAFEYML